MKELTLIIKDIAGNTIDMVMENEKGFKKSIEQNELWCLHPKTKKLIPYSEFGSEGVFYGINKKGKWYEAVLTNISKPGDVQNDVSDSGEINQTAKTDKDSAGPVLSNLVDVIAGRHKQMPEGSYTTHLFNSGEEKIRKKLGEEAVELLLAKKDDEIIYEAADLVYHLLVFLEEKNIPLSAIIEELSNRTK